MAAICASWLQLGEGRGRGKGVRVVDWSVALASRAEQHAMSTDTDPIHPHTQAHPGSFIAHPLCNVQPLLYTTDRQTNCTEEPQLTHHSINLSRNSVDITKQIIVSLLYKKSV